MLKDKEFEALLAGEKPISLYRGMEKVSTLAAYDIAPKPKENTVTEEEFRKAKHKKNELETIMFNREYTKEEIEDIVYEYEKTRRMIRTARLKKKPKNKAFKRDYEPFKGKNVEEQKRDKIANKRRKARINAVIPHAELVCIAFENMTAMKIFLPSDEECVSPKRIAQLAKRLNIQKSLLVYHALKEFLVNHGFEDGEILLDDRLGDLFKKNNDKIDRLFKEKQQKLEEKEKREQKLKEKLAEIKSRPE